MLVGGGHQCQPTCRRAPRPTHDRAPKRWRKHNIKTLFVAYCHDPWPWHVPTSSSPEINGGNHCPPSQQKPANHPTAKVVFLPTYVGSLRPETDSPDTFCLGETRYLPANTLKTKFGHRTNSCVILHTSQVTVPQSPNLMNSARLHKVFQNFVVPWKIDI